MANKDLKYAGVKLTVDGTQEFINNMNKAREASAQAYERMKQFRYIQSSSGGELNASLNVQNQMVDAYHAMGKALETLNVEYKNFLKNSGDGVETAKFLTLIEKQSTKMEKLKAQFREVNVEVLKNENALYQSGKAWQEAGDNIDRFGLNMVKAGFTIEQLASQHLRNVFTVSANAAKELESSIAGVVKVTNLSSSEVELLTNGFRDLSKTVPITTNELATIAEAGGRLYKTVPELMQFTKVMADLNNTTNLVGEEGSDAMMQFATITKTQASEFQKLGSSIVALGNSFATNESSIIQTANRLASSGEAAGFATNEVLAYAAAMGQMGLRADKSGSSLSKLINIISREVESGGDKLAKFAEVAGYSAEEFANAWRENPSQALESFFKGLGQIKEKTGTMAKAMDELGITEVRMSDTVRLLALNHEELSRALDVSNKAWRDGTALQQEAATRYSTTESRLKIQQNRLRDVAVTIGQKLLPILATFAEKVADVIDVFGRLDPNIQNLIVGFGGFIALLGPALTGIGGLVSAFGGMESVLGKVAMKVSLTKEIIPAAQLATDSMQKMTAATVAAGGASTAASAGVSSLAGSFINPTVGLVAAAIAGAWALKEVFRTWTGHGKDLDEVNRNLDNMRIGFRDAADSSMETAAKVKFVSDRLLELDRSSEKTSGTFTLMRTYVAQLNELVPDLGLSFDETTGKINKSEAQLKSYVRQFEQMKKQEAYVKALGDAYSKLAETDLKIATKENDLKLMEEAFKGLNDILDDTGLSFQQFTNNINNTTFLSSKMTDDQLKSAVGYYEKLNSLYDDFNKDAGMIPLGNKFKNMIDFQNTELKKMTDSYSKMGDEITVVEDHVKEALQDTATEAVNANGRMASSTNSMSNSIVSANEAGAESYNALADTADDTTSKIEEDAKNFEESLRDIQSTFGDLTSGAVEQEELTLDDWKTKLEEKLTQYQEWTENMATASRRLPSVFVEELSKMGPAYNDMIGDLVGLSDEQLVPYLSTLGEYFYTTYESAAEQIGYLPEAQQEAFDEMVGILDAYGVDIPSKYYDLASESNRQFEIGSEGIKESVERSYVTAQDAARQKVKDLQDTFINGVSEIPPSVGVKLEPVSDNVSSAMIDADSEAQTGMGRLNSTFATWGETNRQTMEDGSNKSIDVMSKMPTKIAKGILDGSNSVNNAGKNIALNAYHGVGSKNSEMYGVGRNAMQGFINGMYSKSGSVYNTAYSIASSAMRAARSALGVHSPSREMMKIGDYATQGFIRGLLEKKQEVYQSSVSLAEEAMRGITAKDLKASVNASVQFLPSTYSDLYGESTGNGINNNNSTDNTYNVTFQYYGTSEPEAEQFERFWTFTENKLHRMVSGMGGV